VDRRKRRSGKDSVSVVLLGLGAPRLERGGGMLQHAATIRVPAHRDSCCAPTCVLKCVSKARLM